MKKIYPVCTFCCILLCTFCKRQTPAEVAAQPEKTTTQVVDVWKLMDTRRIVALSEIADSISYIPLETKREALISSISQICMKDNEIVVINRGVFSGSNCYVFDRHGKFQNSISRHGQGPGDYLYLYGVSQLPDNDLIYLHDRNKVRIFHTNGRWIRNASYSHQLDSLFVLPPFRMINDSTIVAYATGRFTGYECAMFNIAQDSIYLKKLFSPIGTATTTENIGGMQMMTTSHNLTVSIFAHNDHALLLIPGSDTIRQVMADGNIWDAYILNTGKYRYTFKERVDDNYRFPRVQEKRIFPVSLVESDQYLFVTFDFKAYAPEPYEFDSKYIEGNAEHYVERTETVKVTRVNAMLDKRTGQAVLLNQPLKKQLGFKNDLDSGPVFWPNTVSFNNEMVMTISAEHFLKWYQDADNPSVDIQRLASKLQPDDNPILMIVKLK